MSNINNSLSFEHQSILFQITIYCLFFLICLGLGYPTLNRYNPTTSGGNNDSLHYYNIVKSGPKEAGGHWRYRVLIPYLAKPFYHLLDGNVRSWNPISASLLIVNSLACAGSSLLIIIIGLKLVGDFSISLLGALLFLLNFAISNEQLAGLVDSGECFFLLMMVLGIINHKWWLLPVIAIPGVLNKETFMPISSTFVFIYWAIYRNNKLKLHLPLLISAFAMSIISLITIIVLQSLISGRLIMPWNLIISEKSDIFLIWGIVNIIKDHNFWYIFCWLLPLGLIRFTLFPKSLIYALGAASATALLLGAWNNSGGNVARAIFNISGPYLSLSLAQLIVMTKLKKSSVQHER